MTVMATEANSPEQAHLADVANRSNRPRLRRDLEIIKHQHSQEAMYLVRDPVSDDGLRNDLKKVEAQISKQQAEVCGSVDVEIVPNKYG